MSENNSKNILSILDDIISDNNNIEETVVQVLVENNIIEKPSDDPSTPSEGEGQDQPAIPLVKKVDELENVTVKFDKIGDTRKSITLANHDLILGTGNNCEGMYDGGKNLSGSTFNLAMVSKWNVADFGSNKIHMNLNSVDEITVNDKDKIATQEWVSSVIPTVPSLEGYAKTEELSKKQDVIDDLDNIRSGASSGATALQKENADELYQPKGEYLTEHQDITGKQDVIDDLDNIRSGASSGATALQKENADELYQPKGDYVAVKSLGDYTANNQTFDKKAIVLDKADVITANGCILAQLNAWDVADYGSPAFKLNLNASDVPTIQYPGVRGEDAEHIATQEWIGKELEEKNYALKSDLNSAVKYIDEGNGRKSITLANHDLILGTGNNCEGMYDGGKDLSGSTYNLAMVSKWNVADFGSNKIHMNLNSVDEITVNDKQKVATQEWADEKFATKNEIPSIAGLATEEFVKTSISNVVDNAPEAFDTLKEIADWIDNDETASAALVDEVAGVKTEVANVKKELSDEVAAREALENVTVKFDKIGDTRKSITLANHDLILGTAKDGSTYNLAMVSKWDVADFGSNKIHMNLNSVDDVTVNDKDVVATLTSVETEELPGRKAFVLKNHDLILGTGNNCEDMYDGGKDLSKGTYNLVMLSKWNVADFGSNKIHMNLNSVDEITVNDKDKIATQEWVSNVLPSLDGYAKTEELSEKQDVIDDLADIREGASSGATALQKENADELYASKHNAVSYETFEGTRKTIQLANHDSISGIGTNCLKGQQFGYDGGEDLTGKGFNLVMLSKWNVADFGSKDIELNLNSKVVPTIQYKDGSKEHIASQEFVDANYVSKAQYDTLLERVAILEKLISAKSFNANDIEDNAVSLTSEEDLAVANVESAEAIVTLKSDKSVYVNNVVIGSKK